MMYRQRDGVTGPGRRGLGPTLTDREKQERERERERERVPQGCPVYYGTAVSLQHSRILFFVHSSGIFEVQTLGLSKEVFWSPNPTFFFCY